MTLLERLRAGPAVSDGGTGSELLRRRWEDASEHASVRRPSWVADVHRSFLAAGAEIIVTNSVGLVRRALVAPEASRTLAARGGAIARSVARASKTPVFVAASLGPCGAGSLTERRWAYRQAIAGLLGAAPDAFFIETITELGDASAAIAAVREVFDGPVLVSFAVSGPGGTYAGEPIRSLAAWTKRNTPDLVGLNCGEGTVSLLRAARRLRDRLPDELLALRPSAGKPEKVAGVLTWPESPERFAAFASGAAELGAAIVGGCCGATPAHIAALRSL